MNNSNIVISYIYIFKVVKIGMNFLLGITTGTQKGPKIIVKIVKGPKLLFIMCWCDNLDLQWSKKFIIRIVII